MMYHGIDGRNIKRYCEGKQKTVLTVTQYPCHDKGKQNLCPCNFNGSLIEMKQTGIDGKK